MVLLKNMEKLILRVMDVCMLTHSSCVQFFVTLWTARLLCPWDSPGKNTGVGCHFLLQCMKVKSESEVTQSHLTLSDPMDCSLPGSSIHGVFQAGVLEWVAISSSRGSSQPRDQTVFPALTGGFFTV